ncbi:MAG: hypothetical protein P8M68_00625 [Aquiluna sp.]|nr:hypothetical protein [Aquiluna sp.]
MMNFRQVLLRDGDLVKNPVFEPFHAEFPGQFCESRWIRVNIFPHKISSLLKYATPIN